MSKYNMTNKKGNAFEMGANIGDCQAGDAVKVKGRVEVIKSISKCGKWDHAIETVEGGNYGMMQISAYGRKK